MYGLINKKITIDGKQYILRIPDGGYSTQIDSDSYSGANPSFNEWDSIICNELGFDGLPTGRVEDSNNTFFTLDEFNAPLNKLWNYAEMGSHCFNFSSTHPTTSVKGNTIRGSRRNAKYFSSYNRDIPLSSYGYRPILVLKKEAVNLPTDTSLSEVESKVDDISKEICHNRSKLYAIIKEEDVDITESESKISSLIDKIKYIPRSVFPQWTTPLYQQSAIGTLSEAVRGCAWSCHEGKIFLSKSNSGYYLHTYNISTNTYVRKATPLNTILHQRSCILGNKLYYFNSSTFGEYDMTTDTHSSMSNIPSTGSMDTLGAAKGKLIFKAGDSAGGYVYNLATSTSQYVSKISYYNAWYSYVVTVGKKVFVVSSNRNNRGYIYIDEFNIDTNTSTNIAIYKDAQNTNGALKVFTEGDNIYIYYRSIDTGNYVDKIITYNISDNTFNIISYNPMLNGFGASFDSPIIIDKLVSVAYSVYHGLYYLNLK
ncbi:hypothetical protein [Faecalimicrobium sp. JNUCC 81]